MFTLRALTRSLDHKWRWSCRFFNSFSTQGHDSSAHVYETTDYCDHRGMQLIFLGTSSSIPTLRRNTSCVALRLDGVVFLFDCGEGTQKKLNRTPFRNSAIDSIFITHMHGDHIFGLPGLLSGLGMTGNKSEPLNIYGPEGLRAWIRITLKSCYGRVPSKYKVHEMKLGEEPGKLPKRAKEINMHQDEILGNDFYFSTNDGLWHLLKDQKYMVKAGLLSHSIPCWGFILEEHPRPGRFNIDQAVNLGVKSRHAYNLLQEGQYVTLQNGQKVFPSDVLGPSRRGRKIVILGDTYDSETLLLPSKGADVVVHECTILEEDASEAVKRYHSTATMAGHFARAIDARCLVLTHFSCKFEARPDRIDASIRAAQIAFCKKKFDRQMNQYDLIKLSGRHGSIHLWHLCFRHQVLAHASWHFGLTWFGPFVQLMQAGTCSDMVLSIQNMPGSSCMVCQMALALICFDPIMQHMPNGSWFYLISLVFGLGKKAPSFITKGLVEFLSWLVGNGFWRNSD